MKYVKMLGLAAIAAAALMAFVGVGSASATELTCGASKCEEHTLIKSKSEGKAVLDAPFGNVECESTVEGTTETAGSSTTTAKGPISSLTFTNCGGDTVKVLASGSLEIHTGPFTSPEVEKNGTLTSSGARVTVIHLGVHCIYETENTDIGTLTGSANTKNGHATLDIKATIRRVGGEGGAFCGETAPWTGSYEVTAPSTLNVD